MNNRLIYTLSFGLILLCFTKSCPAQEFKVKSMGSINLASGRVSLVYGSGDLISRDTVQVIFQLYKNGEGEIEGYQLSREGILKLKPGDIIPLHFVNIKVMGSYPRWYDNTNRPIKIDDFGAWRDVTIKSVQESGTRLAIAFDGEIMLEDGRKIQQLDYDIDGDNLTPAKIYKYPAGSPERFLKRIDQTFMEKESQISSWGRGEVISRNGNTVRFKAVANTDGSFAGYKLASPELISLSKGDQVLLYFKSIKMSGNWDKGFSDPAGVKVFRMISGGWRAITIKQITRKSSKIVIVMQENLELENGEKINRIEFQDDKKWALPI